MSNSINDGGAAFPCINPRYDDNWDKDSTIPGMTLRDYFAAKALQSMIVKTPFVPENPEWAQVMSDAAVSAYGYADAMLSARAKGGQDE